MSGPVARYIEDVELGDALPTLSFQPTTPEVIRFCQLWNNPGPNRFTDPEIAKRDGVPGPIVPGVMSMGFMTQAFTRWASNVQVRKLDVVFRQFIVHDRPIQVVAVVTDKDDAAGRLTCDVNIQTPDGQRLVGGQAVVELPPAKAKGR